MSQLEVSGQIVRGGKVEAVPGDTAEMCRADKTTTEREIEKVLRKKSV